MSSDDNNSISQPEHYYMEPLSEDLIDRLAKQVVEIEKDMIDRQQKIRAVIDKIDNAIRDAVRKEIEETEK